MNMDSTAFDSLPNLDYQGLIKEARRPRAGSEAPAVRIAFISDAATQHLIPAVRALLDRRGVRLEAYEGAFGAFELETQDPQSGLHRFQPDVVIALHSIQALTASFYERTIGAEQWTARALERITGVWDALHRHGRATVVQSTFAIPCERSFGNLDLKVGESIRWAANELNTRIAQSARSRDSVLLLDVEGIAGWLGARDFFDARAWDLWKIFCSLGALPHVAKNIVDIVLAARGRVVKCVVLDLDNTLWGGVIGDDGMEGIKIGAHGDGEAFYRLQLFMKELTRRGILLAVCSKNTESVAAQPFADHPEMVLRREHISAFVANWNDKAENIRSIREQLNIGYDAMVFVDDNPFERNLVRQLLPEVIVPELPEDPAQYVEYLSGLNLFETSSFSAEDRIRKELYEREAARRQEAAGFDSVEDFLRSLDMRISVGEFDEFHIPRISQLMRRSNQFNLTTRRLTPADCTALRENPNFLTLHAELSDRLGSHGLISVVTVEREGNVLWIRDWLMSCRVLGRGVEQFLMNAVIQHALDAGLDRVVGTYKATPKNAMVENFFAQFGFVKTAQADQELQWTIDPRDYTPITVLITRNSTEEARI
jgi:FkbH-like protein